MPFTWRQLKSFVDTIKEEDLDKEVEYYHQRDDNGVYFGGLVKGGYYETSPYCLSDRKRLHLDKQPPSIIHLDIY